MCAGDDRNCPDFELHRQKLLDDLDAERRSFLSPNPESGRSCSSPASSGIRAIPFGITSLLKWSSMRRSWGWTRPPP